MRNTNLRSMVNPSTDEMLTKIDSRYTLVVLSSKRARQLLTGEPCKIAHPTEKFVTDAMEEIYEGKINYSMPGVATK